ncbi:MAG: hypothetical protein JXR61_06145 [Prolixibacteraceae bacterium]|nr:hypothetical protein [Prolixibacteraceae bacterium]
MKKVFIVICLIISSLIPYAANQMLLNENDADKSDSRAQLPAEKYRMKRIYQDWGLYIDASPGFSLFKNKNLSQNAWNTEGDYGYKFSAGYFKSLNQWSRLKVGLGLSNYKAHISGNGVFTSPELTDIDNDTYFESLTVTNAKFTANPMYLSIPVTIEFGTANISRIGYYIDFGIEYSYLIHEKNKAQGTYSVTGEYPQWGVTLENIPELGFYAEKNLDSDWKMKKSNISVKGAAGVTIPISGVVIFKVGLASYMGLSNINNKQVKQDNSGPISQEAFEFRSKYVNNPLATSKGSKAFFTGIEFGFYFSKWVK